MMPTPSTVAVLNATDTSSVLKRGNNKNNNNSSNEDRDEDVNDNDDKISISTASVTFVSPVAQKQQALNRVVKAGKPLLQNGSCRKKDGFGSSAADWLRGNQSHPLEEDSSLKPNECSEDLSLSRDSKYPSQTRSEQERQRPPVASLTPGSSTGEVNNSNKPSVSFCPIQLSSPDSSIVSIAETTTIDPSPPDYPTTPPYPPPDDAEFPNLQPSSSIVKVEALVHAEADPTVVSDGDFTPCKPQSECERGNQDSGIVTSSLGTLPSPSRTESVLASSSSILDSPAVRPKHSSRLQSTSSSPKSTRRRNLSSVSSSSSPPPHSRAVHLSSSSLPPFAPNSTSAPVPPVPQCIPSAASIESSLAVSLASPKRRPLLNRPSTSLSAASAASGKDLFESFEGANYSFDSLPGIDELNSYDMPHSKKLVNAKEAFKPTPLDSSPTCELPGWHTSLAQRSLKYLDAPLSSAFEEPPLTFVSANGRGLWGQSGEWDLRTGSGQPVKGPEARSVAAAMAAMLYEEGYSDILPPQVGLNHQLEYPQSMDAPSLVSPVSPSGSLRDETDFTLPALEEEVHAEDVLLTSIVYTGTILPTLHPDMQENLPILPSARDLYENDSSDEDDDGCPDEFRRRRRLPSSNFKIFSGPSTPEEPPPANGFKD